MIRFTRRLALALWAFRHPERLLFLHFDMLRDAQTMQVLIDIDPQLPSYHGYKRGRRDAAALYGAQLYTMPGAEDNRRAL